MKEGSIARLPARYQLELDPNSDIVQTVLKELEDNHRVQQPTIFQLLIEYLGSDKCSPKNLPDIAKAIYPDDLDNERKAQIKMSRLVAKIEEVKKRKK